MRNKTSFCGNWALMGTAVPPSVPDTAMRNNSCFRRFCAWNIRQNTLSGAFRVILKGYQELGMGQGVNRDLRVAL